MILFTILLNKAIKRNKDDIVESVKMLWHKIKPYLTWHFLLCFGIAWMITNGWSYIFIILGSSLDIRWMLKIGFGYLAFLWLPTTPEKIITIPIACWLVRKIFPNDFKTQELIKGLNKKEKKKIEERNSYASKPIWEVLGWV